MVPMCLKMATFTRRVEGGTRRLLEGSTRPPGSLGLSTRPRRGELLPGWPASYPDSRLHRKWSLLMVPMLSAVQEMVSTASAAAREAAQEVSESSVCMQ